MAIDRRSLVTRHNIRWDHPTGRVALGNGEFCFGSDGTAPQTFAGNCMLEHAVLKSRTLTVAKG